MEDSWCAQADVRLIGFNCEVGSKTTQQKHWFHLISGAELVMPGWSTGETACVYEVDNAERTGGGLKINKTIAIQQL